MWSADSIKKFGWNIQKLIEKKDLFRQQSYDMFKQVLLNAQPDLQQGAFLAGRFGIRNPADPKLGLTTANDYTQYINKIREFHA